MSSDPGTSQVRLLLALASAYATLWGGVLLYGLHQLGPQDWQGIVVPLNDDWVLASVWFLAAAAFAACAWLADRHRSVLGLVSITIACVGAVAVVVLGPYRVATATGDAARDVAGLSPWTVVLAWSVVLVFAGLVALVVDGPAQRWPSGRLLVLAAGIAALYLAVVLFWKSHEWTVTRASVWPEGIVVAGDDAWRLGLFWLGGGSLAIAAAAVIWHRRVAATVAAVAAAIVGFLGVLVAGPSLSVYLAETSSDGARQVDVVSTRFTGPVTACLWLVPTSLLVAGLLLSWRSRASA